MKPFPVRALEASLILTALREARRNVAVLLDATDGEAHEHAVTASSALYHAEEKLAWIKDDYDWEATS